MEGEKEYYRLRYEYLKESDAYKKYCEWRREKSIVVEGTSLYKPFIPPYPVDDPPQELSEYENFDSIERLVYPYWGDIFTTPFEGWWGGRGKVKLNPFQDLLQIIDQEINMCTRYYRACKKKEPSALDFKDWLFSQPYLRNPQYLCLKIDVTMEITEELKKEFGEIVKERKKSPQLKQAILSEVHPVMPVSSYSKSNLKELRRYLEIFKLKKRQKLTWKEVIKRIDPAGKIHEGEDEIVERSWKRELQKANNIIKNVERGDFPGDY